MTITGYSVVAQRRMTGFLEMLRRRNEGVVVQFEARNAQNGRIPLIAWEGGGDPLGGFPQLSQPEDDLFRR